MRLRRLSVTVADDVQRYVDAVKPLYRGFETTWDSIIWTLEHRAEEIGEHYAGSTYIAKTRLSRQQPVVKIVYKLSDTTAQIVDFELLPDGLLEDPNQTPG